MEFVLFAAARAKGCRNSTLPFPTFIHLNTLKLPEDPRPLSTEGVPNDPRFLRAYGDEKGILWVPIDRMQVKLQFFVNIDTTEVPAIGTCGAL